MPYKDKKDQRKAQREWWHRNKEKQKPKVDAYRKKNKKKIRRKDREYAKSGKLSVVWLRGLKEQLFCEFCGETDSEVLDLHHIDPDTKSFGLCVTNARKNINDVIEEVNKCAALCACCHRKTHSQIRLREMRMKIARESES